MTLQERCESFNAAYAKWPASHLSVVREAGGDVMYGRWLIGNNYRATAKYYGAYPPGYLDRAAALFPDVYAHGSTWRTNAILHAFSGSIGDDGYYTRCDEIQPAELKCRIEDIGQHVIGQPFHLIYADPPYSSADAVKYGTRMVHRGRATAALAQVTRVGGFLAWLDTCWPMHNKKQWRTVARIAITRSTNHRVRDLTIFERQP